MLEYIIFHILMVILIFFMSKLYLFYKYFLILSHLYLWNSKCGLFWLNIEIDYFEHAGTWIISETFKLLSDIDKTNKKQVVLCMKQLNQFKNWSNRVSLSKQIIYLFEHKLYLLLIWYVLRCVKQFFINKKWNMYIYINWLKS